MTFDEGYGSKPEFLRELSARHQKFVGEVPRNFMGWIRAPRVVTREYANTGGAAAARCRAGQRQRAGESGQRDARSAGVRRSALGAVAVQGWTQGADGLGGRIPAAPPGGRRRPAGRAAVPDRGPRHPEPGVLKFFVSNAPAGTSVQTMLLVAFSRSRMEPYFGEDQKSEIGLDQSVSRRVSRELNAT